MALKYKGSDNGDGTGKGNGVKSTSEKLPQTGETATASERVTLVGALLVALGSLFGISKFSKHRKF
ncbi:hypothetical protein JCM15457_2049 [Liquorilactobacillus sucicola DSM 21376 = JCM 15457]|nr:hypothetical protein JCM15457_2049 [Liquorilactobacillus sucicola DSM 21376 = JCM 15457]